MDPLSITASVIAIAELTSKAVNYLNGVKNASKDQERCALEASSLFTLLTSLKYRLEDTTPTDPWYARVLDLGTENGALSQYKVALERLVNKIVPKNKAGKVTAPILWPFKQKEVAEILAAIERLKSLIGIALEMDHFKLSLAIEEDTSQIPDLVRGVGELRLHQDDDKFEKICSWLSPTDYLDQQADIWKKRQDETGTWFLESPVFSDWVNGSDSTLFCPGSPGAGKTMVSSLVIDHLRNISRDDTVGVAFLYCNYKADRERRAEDLLSALLRQLVQHLPSTLDTVEPLYDKYAKHKTRLSFNEISAAMSSVCDRYTRVFIVVDALDECPNQHREALISELKNLRASRVSLMVTSRPVDMVSEHFKDAVKLQIETQREDVEKFVESKVSHMGGPISRNQDLRQLVISTISDAVIAEGIFLLAQLQLDSLKGKTNPKAIKATLRSLPRGHQALSQTYRDAIERIDSQSPEETCLAKKALSWIICATQPLSTKQLEYALLTEDGESKLDEENITEISDLVVLCAGLITVDQHSDVVRLVHYTAQEYFDNAWNSVFPEAHKVIATTCLVYLSFYECDDVLITYDDVHIILDDTKFFTHLYYFGLYRYAAKNWGYHARIASMEESSLLLDFLENHERLYTSMEVLSFDDSAWTGPINPTAMSVAAFFGLWKTMTALSKAGHDLHSRDSDQRTPIFYAAMSGEAEVVHQILATNSAHPDPKDKDDRTPLSLVSELGHEAIARLLLATKGVDPDSKDSDGLTPLSYAAGHGRKAIVKLLLATKGVDLNSKDSHGATPLCYAAVRGYGAIVKLLLATKGVDPDSKDSVGSTPLSYAAGHGRKAIVKLLLATKGVNLDSRDIHGMTPLAYAAEMGLAEVVGLLLAKDGVNIDSRDILRRTPLSYAAERGHTEVVELLLITGGAYLDSRDSVGRTPLSYAAESGHTEVVELLLATGGVNLDSRDHEGFKPLSYAALRKHAEVVELLSTKAGL